MNRLETGIPVDPRCAGCGSALEEPFGWCSNCREAFCAECGAGHYCLPECRVKGCLAGFCVREVRDGVLGPWRSVSRET